MMSITCGRAVFFGSHHLQPLYRALACGELASLDADALEHGDVQIGQWVIVHFVEGEMLAVLEAAAPALDEVWS